jgi:NADH:ubiquinone oxidoreductase subunit 6 (subunit J)
VKTLAKSTNIFSWLSLLVIVFGFGVMGMSDPKYHVTIASTWIWLSIVLYVIALGLSLFLVVPTMRTASAEITAGTAAKSYAPIAAGSGIGSLFLLAVVVLMGWNPERASASPESTQRASAR